MEIPRGVPIGPVRRPSRGPERARDGLLLIGHGSRCVRSEAEMHALADMVSQALATTAVEVGFLEMTDPPAGEALDRLVARGCRTITVLPLVLLDAGHSKSDAPAVVVAGRGRHPGVSIRFGSPLGVAREPVEMLGKAVTSAGGAGLPLLVVARGSSDPDANSDAFKAARLVGEWAGSPLVQVGFSGITGPSVKEASEVMVRLGFKRVAVAWWFLCHGKLIERGRAEMSEVFSRAGVAAVDAGYIGPDPRLVPLIMSRMEAAASASGAHGCDVCAYRAPWPGLEDRVGQPIGVGHSHLAAEHLHPHSHPHGHTH